MDAIEKLFGKRIRFDELSDACLDLWREHQSGMYW
jgi:hypothetical protein